MITAILPAKSQRKRAFMVGISNYDSALTGYQWNNINGLNDIMLLSPKLKQQGFQITTVLDEQATYDTITKQLSSFISQSKAGDIVYLHFSTHGQPIEDISGDETDGWDEAIIPIDAYKDYKKGFYEGEKHLLDDQLNTYLKELRLKIGTKGLIYVVIDACHAGTASRGNDEITRGTYVGFTKNNKVFRPSKDNTSHYSIRHQAKQADLVCFEACRADQVNTEVRVNGIQYGSLSFHLAKVLSKTPIGRNPDIIIRSLRKTILQSGIWPSNQNLVIESSIPK